MNDIESQFIKEQNLPLELFVDANGKSVNAEFKIVMKASGKIFAFNSTPCLHYGHTLRERSGHCIQCDTARISFMKRHVSFGTIYLAGSIKGGLIKVGSTSAHSLENRFIALNREKYGEQNDWILLFQFDSVNVGEVEFAIHDSLKDYSATNLFYREKNESTEVFRCGFQKAIEASLKSVTALGFTPMNTKWNTNEILINYNFPNLRKV